MKEEFTIEQGIEVQTRQLEQWEKLLKEEVYNDLKAWAVSTNSEAKTGFSIRRGNDLDNYIGNYHYYKEGRLK
jgi:hypothetical protein